MMDSVTRESHRRMVELLARRYQRFGADLIVAQALFGRRSIDELPDDELAELHELLERARQSITEGISLEEAGLLGPRR